MGEARQPAVIKRTALLLYKLQPLEIEELKSVGVATIKDAFMKGIKKTLVKAFKPGIYTAYTDIKSA